MKISISIPDELWDEAMDALGMSAYDEMVSASKFVQMTIREWVEANPGRIQHKPCECAYCRSLA